MSKFTPGRIVKTFSTKKGDKAVIRYPFWEDLDQILAYINKLSKEDTFITLSGEKLTRKDEAGYLADWFKAMEMGDKVFLFCFVADKLVATCSVDRNTKSRQRSRHTASFGISVAKEFRSSGVGYNLASTVIAEAKKKIKGLKLIALSVYEKNKIALNLYKKLGFKKAGVIPGGVLYCNEYIDEIKMYLRL
jgi:RimJ/RimL family protein N-acetyltransferase